MGGGLRLLLLLGCGVHDDDGRRFKNMGLVEVGGDCGSQLIIASSFMVYPVLPLKRRIISHLGKWAGRGKR